MKEESKNKIEKLKRLIKSNYYQVIIVFVAFIAMILVSCFYVASIVSDQRHQLGVQTLETTKTAVTGDLESAGLLFSDVVRAGSKMIVEGRGKDAIKDYLEDVQDYYVKDGSPLSAFLKVYGYFDGDFIDGSGWIPPDWYDATQRPWYIGAAEANGGLFFSEPYLDADTAEMCVSFSQSIDSKNTFAVDLSLFGITDYISKQQISNNGYGLFISDKFTFAAHKNIEYINKPMAEAGKGYEKLQKMLESGEQILGVRFKDTDNIESVAFFETLFNGWHIGIVTPYSSYIQQVIYLAIIISLLGLALALALSLLLLYTSYQKMKSQDENLSKSTFLARMSHEMRTPMNAIIGMTDIAQKTQDFYKVQDCVKKISVASNHLLGVINDVLDMSKIEAGKLELFEEEFDFHNMIDQVKTVIDFKVDDKKQNFIINISPSVPKFIVSDRQRLAQVITNLLSNAIKFTPENGKITLNIDIDNDILKVEVIDTGIGISEEQQSKLFRSFEQADNSISRKYGGTGLGLAISKKIVELMGGETGLESELGKGSKFYFSVKIKRGSASSDAKTKIEKIESFENLLQGKHILLAEDVEVNREIAIALLEETGVSIDCAENGLIAFQKFQNSLVRYDLILMDIHMPQMNGFEATRRIRELNTQYAKNIPIIAMTANVFKEDIDNCYSAGMNAHTGKPIDLNDLIEKMLKFLR